MPNFRHCRLILIGGLLFQNCQQNAPNTASNTAQKPIETPQKSLVLPKNPAERFGALFDTVQLSGIFPDSKTFVNYVAKMEDAQIIQNFEAQRQQPNFDLRAFVAAHFDAPPQYGAAYKTDLSQSAEQHIADLWQVLARQPDANNPKNSLLPLPYSYVVPWAFPRNLLLGFVFHDARFGD